MQWCTPGQHTFMGAFCGDHPPARDRPRAGRCDWGRGHEADAVWVTPRDGKSWCLDHLKKYVHRASWGWKR